MNIFRRVAWKSMRHNRTRTVVTIIGVILSVAMFTAVTTTVSTLANYLQRESAYNNGAYFVSFDAVDTNTLSQIQADGDVDALASAEYLGYAVISDTQEYPLYAYVTAMDAAFPEQMSVHMVSGRLPETGTEIILPEHLVPYDAQLTELGSQITLALGDRVSNGQILYQDDPYDADETLAARETRTYTIVGIYERPGFESYSDTGYSALTVAEEAVTGIYDVYVRTTDNSSDAVNDFSERYASASVSAEINWEYLSSFGTFRYDNLDSAMINFVCILIFLIMLGSISLIYNAFSISVSERTKQFGLLSSIGATRKQLRRTVTHEALLIFLIGTPLGLLAGVGGMALTFTLLKSQLTTVFGMNVDLQFSVSLMSLAVASGVGLVTVLISAFIPAIRAMRVSAIDAIRQSRDVKTTKRDTTSGKLAYRLFGLPGMLSKKYFHRSRKKYRATIISLAMSVLLFVSASTYGMYLTQSVETVGATEPYDFVYSSTSDLSDVAQLLRQQEEYDAVYTQTRHVDISLPLESYSESYLNYCKHNKEVSGYDPLYSNPYVGDGYMIYIDDVSFDAMLEASGFDRAEYDAAPDAGGLLYTGNVHRTYYDSDGSNRYVYSGSILRDDITQLSVVQVTAPEGYDYLGTKWDGGMQFEGELLSYFGQLGDLSEERGGETISLPAQLQSVSIWGSTKADPIGISSWGGSVAVYFPLSALDATAQTGELYVYTGSDEATTLQSIQDAFEAAGADYNADSLYNLMEQERSTRNLITVISVFSYGFIILITLICIANVFNTISTNIAMRRRDFAMLRSMGMTRGALNRMVNYECLLYGIRALVIACPLTLGLTWLMYSSTGAVYSSEFAISVPAVIVAVLGVFVVVFASMMYAMRKIKKENPIDALKEENT